jgi:dTDP-4-amino-4,6-dideoxygalactose transaminase
MADRIEFVDLGAMHRSLAGEIEAAIRRVCRTNAFIGGTEVAQFEEEWASFTGAHHAVGVANGTDAIQLVLMAAGLTAGSVVAVPANTFIATAESVVAAGHTVRFVDVDADSGLIDLAALSGAIDDGISAVIVVHLYGRMVDLSSVRSLAEPRNVLVIEDAAQAHGARLGGRHAGTIGLAGTFSFYPGKNLGAMGDAGAVVTDDEGLADMVRLLRDHGRRTRDRHEMVGLSSRLDGLQAAILRAKLPHLERWNAARATVADRYRSALDPALLDWTGHPEPAAESHHLFPILTDERDELAGALAERGIATGVHYRMTCPMAPAFGGRAGYPVAERRAQRQLSLPVHPYMSAPDVSRVIDGIGAFLGH